MELKAEISLKSGYVITIGIIYDYVKWLIFNAILGISVKESRKKDVILTEIMGREHFFKMI